MRKFMAVGFCGLFLLGVLSTAWGQDRIAVNHFKTFKGGSETARFLSLNLAMDKSTRVHILVTRQGEILEYHRLVTGPKGVWNGRNKGATKWGCVLPEGARGRGYQVTVMVMPVAEGGDPVGYEIYANPTGASGDGFNTASLHLK